jgi:hypothetical protein
MLTTKRLFRAEDDSATLWNVLNRRVAPMRDLVPDLPDDVASVIDACLERRPRDRPPNALVLAERCAAHAPSSTHGARELERHMNSLFAADRAREEERLASALREEPPGPIVEIDSADSEVGLPDVTSVDRHRPRSSRFVTIVALGLATLSVASIVGFFVVASLEGADGRAARAPADVSADPPTREAARAPAQAASEPAPRREEVRIEIPPRARVVLVDGVRRDERPIVLQLLESEQATVELVDSRGDLHAFRVDPARRVWQLDLGDQTRPRPVQQRRSPRSEPPVQATAAPSMMDLFDDPYAPRLRANHRE